MIDHLDGSNCYTKYDGKEKGFDTKTPYYLFKNADDKKPFTKMLDTRVLEVEALIDEIEGKDYAKSLFGEAGATVGIDMSNLIVSGHSMGGATAMLVGDKDARVKCVLSHDPWSKLISE